MGAVFEIHQKRFFSIEEARELLPVVRRITKRAYEEVRKIGTQLSYASDPKKKSELEDVAQALFRDWYEKVRRLGCEAKGMWLVDFDSGEGYYCWHFPEPDIIHYHSYHEGFSGRVKIH